MSDILAKIVERRRVWIAEQQAARPASEILALLTRSDRDFEGALRAVRPAYILEYKQASPSQGAIRASGDLPAVAAAYAPFASAISVLTEPDFFAGSFDDLRRMRALVTQPVLCKDFIVDPYQILLAREAGADAILLILAILTDAQYQELAALAASWGMAVLSEIADRQEQQRAIRLGARIVGINNRNLRDFTIDPQRTIDLAAELPGDTLVISESGFAHHDDVRRLAGQADGFLVGSALMRDATPSLAAKRLIFGQHKVCGLTRSEDAQAAAAVGAVYGGVILAERSPRRVDVQRAQFVFAETDLLRVGVVQDQPLEKLVEWARLLDLAVLQLHGHESLEDVRTTRQSLPAQVEIWRAVGVEALTEGIAAWLDAGVDRVVVDHVVGERRGGTGQTFDWSRLPANGRDRIMLAGGINAGNIRAAIDLGVAGVDLNSGVEDSPGIKSPARLREVFQRVRTL